MASKLCVVITTCIRAPEVLMSSSAIHQESKEKQSSYMLLTEVIPDPGEALKWLRQPSLLQQVKRPQSKPRSRQPREGDKLTCLANTSPCCQGKFQEVSWKLGCWQICDNVASVPWWQAAQRACCLSLLGQPSHVRTCPKEMEDTTMLPFLPGPSLGGVFLP